MLQRRVVCELPLHDYPICSDKTSVQELKNAGTWDSIFIDDDYRVFKANNKNVFVLKKLVE